MKLIESLVLSAILSSVGISSSALACFKTLSDSEALARKAEVVDELLRKVGRPAGDLFAVEFASFPTHRGTRGDCSHVQYATEVTVTWDDDSGCHDVYKVVQVRSKILANKLLVNFDEKVCD